MSPSFPSYADIPEDEKKQLTAQAFRQSPSLRTIRWASIVVPILGSSSFAGLAGHSSEPALLRVGAAVTGAWVLSVIIWESFGRRRLKAEIVKLRSA